jgi:multidrug efflux pump subunit AcrB
VDNSIVIVENIKRYIGLGYNQKEAAVEGTRQLAWPIVSATATTMLAFIPIIAMPDKSGAFIRTMPITVVYTLAASLFIALTLTPFLSSIVLKRKTKEIQSWFSKQLKSLNSRPLSEYFVICY